FQRLDPPGDREIARRVELLVVLLPEVRADLPVARRQLGELRSGHGQFPEVFYFQHVLRDDLAVGGGQSGCHPGPLRAQLRRGEREGEGEGESEERCPAEGKGSCVVRACETHQSSSWSSGKGIRRRTRRVTAGARRP